MEKRQVHFTEDVEGDNPVYDCLYKKEHSADCGYDVPWFTLKTLREVLKNNSSWIQDVREETVDGKVIVSFVDYAIDQKGEEIEAESINYQGTTLYTVYWMWEIV